jgi:hypothetical protein
MDPDECDAVLAAIQSQCRNAAQRSDQTDAMESVMRAKLARMTDTHPMGRSNNSRVAGHGIFEIETPLRDM